MKTRTIARIHLAVLIGAVLTAGCSESQFPTTPAPVANAAPVVNLGGANYQGNITLSNGTTTSFNMTLIARGLGITHQITPAAQAPGTVEITGSFETGSGLKGGVQGMLDGTLENGTFQGNLDVPGCTRGYSGPMSASGFAWSPTGNPAPGCPLTFVIQIPRPLGPGCTYAASPSRSSFSGNGGTATVSVVAADGCPWAAESLVPWISIADPKTATGAGKITFTVSSNSGTARQGTMRVAGHTIGISQGLECKYSVVPSTTSVGGSGGTGSIKVTAPEGCEWSASSGVDWLTLSASSGTGDGVLTFTAKPNSGAARQGTLQVAGQSVTISQGPACRFSVTPANASVPAAGGSGKISVTGPTGCEWKAESGAPWVTVAPARDSGNGAVTFTAQANSGPSRETNLEIAGHTVHITQSAAGCVDSISPPNAAFQPAGGTGNVAVTTRSDCTWTATSNDPWIQVTSGASGQGNGTVSYGVQANAGAERVGTLLIAGQTFTVTQAAAGCPNSISPPNAAFQSSGGTGTVAVTTRSDCSWTATSNDPWIQVTSGASGQGNGTVSYGVQANSSDDRTGTMLVAGHTFTVTQAAAPVPCAFSLAPTNESVPADGGSFSTVLTLTGSCSGTWTASSDASWITIRTGTSGTTGGTITYGVTSNPGAARTGHITVQGAGGSPTLTVTQAALPLTTPVQVSPPDGSVFSHFPRTTNFSWTGVTGGTTYRIEVDCQGCCSLNQWCTDVGRTWFVSPAITVTSYTHDFVGAQPGRWRVWAIDASGNEGPKSGWWGFRYTN